jgi:hypothetical protein
MTWRANIVAVLLVPEQFPRTWTLFRPEVRGG